MRLIDLYPSKGTFPPGETIRLIADIQAERAGEASIRLCITHLAETVAEFETTIYLESGQHHVPVEWFPKSVSRRGYGATAHLLEDGILCSTAFDVLSSWTEYPRYGFLCDFRPERNNIDATLDSLLKYHINGLQFYDWQFRHDTLISPQEKFLDPLGRKLSLNTIENFIHAAHRRGMAAMPYLTVYAASNEFAQKHPTWALYDESGVPHTFEDFLGLMDPSPDSPWMHHLLNQCDEVLQKMPFDGIHVDQYGEPRTGFTATGESVNIPESFGDFIKAMKANHPQTPITFNAVKNWPINALAIAPLDFLYIELWPSSPSYRDVLRIISEARAKSSAKPMVIALYLPTDRPVNVRLVDALILAAGATRIELGEDERLLTDPYFPKHEAIDGELKQTLRSYADFAVRFGNLVGPWAEDYFSLELDLPEGVWSVARRSGNHIVVSLINMRGLEDTHWADAHPAPPPIKNFTLDLKLKEKVTQVFYASPDTHDPALRPIAWKVDGQTLNTRIPNLDIWTMLIVETEAQQRDDYDRSFSAQY